MPYIVTFTIHNVNLPCLTSSFGFLCAALLKVTQIRLVEPRILSNKVLVVMVMMNFAATISADIISVLYVDLTFVVLLCGIYFVVWGIVFFVCYAVVFVRFYRGFYVNRQKLKADDVTVDITEDRDASSVSTSSCYYIPINDAVSRCNLNIYQASNSANVPPHNLIRSDPSSRTTDDPPNNLTVNGSSKRIISNGPPNTLAVNEPPRNLTSSEPPNSLIRNDLQSNSTGNGLHTNLKMNGPSSNATRNSPTNNSTNSHQLNTQPNNLPSNLPTGVYSPSNNCVHINLTRCDQSSNATGNRQRDKDGSPDPKAATARTRVTGLPLAMRLTLAASCFFLYSSVLGIYIMVTALYNFYIQGSMVASPWGWWAEQMLIVVWEIAMATIILTVVALPVRTHHKL